MIDTIDHVTIVVSDLERSVHFYTKLLGFQETHRTKLEGKWIERIIGFENVRAEVVYVEAPGGAPGATNLELLYFETPKGGMIHNNSSANTIGVRHMAFQVQNIHAAVQGLKDEGVRFISEPVVVPENVMQNKKRQKTLCYFLDPDGVLLELAERKDFV